MPKLLLRALLACALVSPAIAAEPEPFDAGRFETTLLLQPLSQPMQFQVARDGRIFYIELRGKLQVFHPDTHQVVTAAALDLFTDQENGLLGMALDPHFEANHWIYLQYSPKTHSGQHISRFTMNGDTLDRSSEKILLKTDDQRKECCHHAGSMHFGPDGCLYIGTGDNTNPFGSDGFGPFDPRPNRSPWDASKSAGNTNDLRGKILRIKPEPDGTASIPPGNLFPPGTPNTRPEIYVMGCRNPWRLNIDQKTGILYWGEVGPDAGGDSKRGPMGYDEINQARGPGNFGWPFLIANNKPYARYNWDTKTIGEFYDPAHPINDSPNNTGLRQLPPAQSAFLWYPYGKSREFPQLDADGGRTACAGPVFHADPAITSSSRFPAYYDNCLFIFEWSRNWIKAVRLDADSHIVGIEPFMPDHNFIRPVDMQFAPDGSLYVMEYGTTWGENKDARLIRVDYVRGNRAPIARATAKNNIGKQPLAVSFSARESLDKDPGDSLTYEWRNATTSQLLSTQADPTVTFNTPGQYNIQLTVTDAHGAKAVQTLPIMVGNAPPHLAFTAPQEGTFFDWDRPIVYKVAVRDEEDGSSADHEVEMSTRLSVEGQFVGKSLELSAIPASQSSENDPPGLALAKRSDCFNCHAVDRKVVGPAYLDVAAKYRGDPKALDASIQRVINGSTGVWGNFAMLPHLHHTQDDVRAMVQWVYSLDARAASAKKFAKGVNADINPGPAPTNGHDSGVFLLTATYLDTGYGPVGPLPGTATFALRSRKVEAEFASAIHGSRILDGGYASNHKFVGDIHDGDWLRIAGVNLRNTASVTFHAASAGTGGAIELHADSPTGPLLCSVDLKPTGGWEKWTDLTAPLSAPPAGRHDLYIRFSNPGKSGLMNLDYAHFNRAD